MDFFENLFPYTGASIRGAHCQVSSFNSTTLTSYMGMTLREGKQQFPSWMKPSCCMYKNIARSKLEVSGHDDMS